MQHNFSFLTLTPEQFSSRPDLLAEIRDGKVSGVIVKNFLSESETAQLASGYFNLDEKRCVLPNEQGYTYPTVFAHVKRDTEDNREKYIEYFQRCENFKTHFEKDFGLPVPGRIQKAFSDTAGGRSVKIPSGYYDQGEYPFSTFRELIPGSGEMALHCGLLFYELFPSFFEQLHTVVARNNQLSFFMMLQKPEAGGELTIYDVLWNEVEKKISDQELLTKDGNTYNVDQNPNQFPLNIQNGDLLIFDGGTIWHRVELVKGNKNRLTFGGFLGFTHDDKEIFYWS